MTISLVSAQISWRSTLGDNDNQQPLTFEQVNSNNKLVAWFVLTSSPVSRHNGCRSTSETRTINNHWLSNKSTVMVDCLDLYRQDAKPVFTQSLLFVFIQIFLSLLAVLTIQQFSLIYIKLRVKASLYIPNFKNRIYHLFCDYQNLCTTVHCRSAQFKGWRE